MTMEKSFALDDIRKFLNGEKTWAEMAGITKQQAYAIADLGYNLFMQGKLNEAKKIFEGLISLNPRDSYFHSVLGSIYARSQRWEEALVAFDLAIKNGTLDPQVYVNRAEIFLEGGKFEEALQDLNQAISLDPKVQSPATVRAHSMAKTTAHSIKSVLEKSV